ncbi:MAG: hypothetical protein RIR12_122 [Bacteroidota bacterium]|jgi:hypothetical protein
MQFQVPIEIQPLPTTIGYGQHILLMGSCFTEHIGNALAEYKFNVLQNPNGILFGPDAVCKSLLGYMENKQYTESELFYLNETWNSWDHHSRFSAIHKEQALHTINTSQNAAHTFLQKADWLIITLGSSFVYPFTDVAEGTLPNKTKNATAANCHRAPSNWFSKRMLAIEEIKSMMEETVCALRKAHPQLKIIFTVSPVRHIRDGVVENNRSKARLIETVHHLSNHFENVFYFPAYELVIDVLRDYRFYDVDLVHPNYQATSFVLEKFIETCIDPKEYPLMKELKKISIAKKHKPFHPDTQAHQQFLASNFQKVKELMATYPYLPLQAELDYFKSSTNN